MGQNEAMTPSAAPGRDYGGRSAQQRRADRRERLLTAAFELFGSQGYAATSIERLCATAGVSTRNFYQEFDGRDAVLIALHDRFTAQATAATAEVLDTADAPLERRIDLALRAYLSSMSSDPRWIRVAFVEMVGVSAAVEQHRLGWRARLYDLIAAEAKRGVADGELRDRDFRPVAVAFVGAVNEVVYDWETRGRPTSLDHVCAELSRLAVAMFTAT